MSVSIWEKPVLEEQVRTVYKKGRIALLTNLVNALILVVVLWNELPPRLLGGWLGTMYAANLIRLWLWGRQARPSRAPYNAAYWGRLWTIGTGVTGLLWGFTGAFFSPPNPFAQTLVLVLIAGMVAGASATMSSYLPAFLAFSIPAVLPVVLRHALARTDAHDAVAIFALIFILGMVLVSTSSERVFKQAVRTGLKNQFLAEDLDRARAQLTQANAELERRVEQRTQELEVALADRDRFISVVSHELRTPLSALTLNLELLGRTVDAPALEPVRLRRLLQSLPRQVSRIQRLVDDLLDVSRVSAERMRYLLGPVRLHQVVGDALDQLEPQMLASEARFEVQVEEELVGRWDRARIEQVLLNLMSNALRYGRPPYALVAKRVGNRAHIIVRDQGEGISAPLMERMFEPFSRGESRGGAAGLGLGLYIAKRIVQAHQGSIRAVSAPGAGTEFIIELPLGEPQAPLEAPTPVLH